NLAFELSSSLHEQRVFLLQLNHSAADQNARLFEFFVKASQLALELRNPSLSERSGLCKLSVGRQQSHVVFAYASAALEPADLAIHPFDFRNQLLVLACDPRAFYAQSLDLFGETASSLLDGEVFIFQSGARVFSHAKRVFEVMHAF